MAVLNFKWAGKDDLTMWRKKARAEVCVDASCIGEGRGEGTHLSPVSSSYRPVVCIKALRESYT